MKPEFKPTSLPTDYGLACEIGREYAARFAQYLKDNPCLVGSNTLGHIAADIDFKKDESGAKGYWVGFFSHLERLIHEQAQRMDVFADVNWINAHYAGIAAKRALEAGTEVAKAANPDVEETLRMKQGPFNAAERSEAHDLLLRIDLALSDCLSLEPAQPHVAPLGEFEFKRMPTRLEMIDSMVKLLMFHGGAFLDYDRDVLHAYLFTLGTIVEGIRAGQRGE